MRSRLSLLGRSVMSRLTILAVSMLLLGRAALAQTSTTFLPYDTLASGGKDEVSAAAAAFAPVVIGLLVGMVCLGLLFIWLKKGAKST